MVGVAITTGFDLPSEGPLSLARVKEHLRVVGDDEDSLIADYIRAAIHYVQDYTGRGLMACTWRQTLDRFPPASGPIFLARHPVVSVSGITYRDTSGASQSIASASLILTASDPAQVSPLDGASWPTDVSRQPGAVAVSFVAGINPSDDTQLYGVQAVYLLVGHWFGHRGDTQEMPQSVRALLDLCRVPWMGE